MITFRHHDRLLDPVPTRIVQMLTSLERSAGTVQAIRDRHSEQLKTLVDVARVESTEASNAIEDITAPAGRIKALMRDETAPRDRSEEQIAGYRYVLDYVHASHDAMDFSENLVKQMHKDIYRFTGVRHGGCYKATDNSVKETHPDGREVTRFRAPTPTQTREWMPELHERYADLAANEAHHPLLLTGAYVFDFLMIHPFQDGNGRTARLITLLLVYQAGHDVGRYISLERLINEARDSYYDALGASTAGWYEPEHSIWPWMEYLLGILIAAYGEFDARISAVTDGRGAKGRAVREFIRARTVAEFTIDDIRRNTPAGDDLIRQVLAQLRKEEAIVTLTRGPRARYRRIRDDF
jgi:Fic family protein